MSNSPDLNLSNCLRAGALAIARIIYRDKPAKVYVVVDSIQEVEQKILPAVARYLTQICVPAYFIFSTDSSRITLRTKDCSVILVTGPGPWLDGHVMHLVTSENPCERSTACAS